jgi:O-antigen ligase
VRQLDKWRWARFTEPCESSRDAIGARSHESGAAVARHPLSRLAPPRYQLPLSRKWRQVAAVQKLHFALNAIILVLVLLSLVLVQCLIGGTRLLFSLPSYGVLALAGILTVGGLARVPAGASRACLASSGMLLTYILARAATSPVQYLWWPDFYMVLGCLVLYLLTSLRLTSTRLRIVFAMSLVVLALFQVFVGLRQFSGGDNWMPFGFVRADYGRRASGMFISSIHLAGFLEVALGFALSIALWTSLANWIRFLFGYLAVVCLLGIAITGSRGGYLSTMVSLGTFFVLSIYALKRAKPAKYRATAWLSGLALLLALGAAFSMMQRNPMIRERLALIGKKDVRIYNWQAALDQFRTAPWLGTGAGTHLYYGRLFRRPEIQADPVHAHSDYLELLAEYGIVGGIGMALFLAAHLRVGWREFARLVRERLARRELYEPVGDSGFALQLGCLCAVAAYLAHSVVDFNLHIPANALVFAFIFGVLARPECDKPAPETACVVVAAAAWALPALSVVILGAGLPKLPGEYWCERARLAMRDRQFQKAIELGTRALHHQRLNPELYFYIGYSHLRLGQTLTVQSLRPPFFEAAVTHLRASLALFPQDENAWVRLGQALDGLKRFAEAEQAYLEAIRLDPNLGVLFAYYAAHLNARGRYDEAAEQLATGQKLTSENLAKIGESTLPPPEAPDSPPSQ